MASIAAFTVNAAAGVSDVNVTAMIGEDVAFPCAIDSLAPNKTVSINVMLPTCQTRTSIILLTDTCIPRVHQWYHKKEFNVFKRPELIRRWIFWI